MKNHQTIEKAPKQHINTISNAFLQLKWLKTGDLDLQNFQKFFEGFCKDFRKYCKKILDINTSKEPQKPQSRYKRTKLIEIDLKC